jgi:hypothetical protein
VRSIQLCGCSKCPKFYGTRRFITVFARAFHRPLSGARSIQSIPPHTISLRSILILSTHPRIGLPNGLFPSGFLANIVYAFLFSLFMLHAFLTHLPSLDHSNYTWRRIQVPHYAVSCKVYLYGLYYAFYLNTF